MDEENQEESGEHLHPRLSFQDPTSDDSTCRHQDVEADNNSRR